MKIGALMPTRDGEIEKYAGLYKSERYRMGEERKRNSSDALREFKAQHQSYLDVGAGRGEMLDFAVTLGFTQVMGTEVVPALLKDPRMRKAEAHALPFKTATWDVVSCFDVLEHLVPADVTPAIDELFRVARHVVIVSAASDSQRIGGVEHHISKRPLPEWEKLILSRARGWTFAGTRPCRKGSLIWQFTK